MSITKTRGAALHGHATSSPALRFDRAHGIVELAVDNARGCLLNLQKEDGHWAAELQGDTILESEFILLMAFLGREREDRIRKAARYIVTQERPDGGWSLLSRRPRRRERHRQGVLRSEAGRPRSRRPLHAAGPRGRSATGRRRPLQQLQQVLSGLPWPIPLRKLPDRAGRDDVPAEVGVFQHLCHVELDADHRRAAQHLLGLQAGPTYSARTGNRRAVRAAPANAPLASSADAPLAHGHQLFPGRRSAAEALRILRSELGAQRGRRQGECVDARPFRRERRRRRHFPADHLYDHQSALPGLCATIPPR